VGPTRVIKLLFPMWRKLQAGYIAMVENIQFKKLR